MTLGEEVVSSLSSTLHHRGCGMTLGVEVVSSLSSTLHHQGCGMTLEEEVAPSSLSSTTHHQGCSRSSPSSTLGNLHLLYTTLFVGGTTRVDVSRLTVPPT